MNERQMLFELGFDTPKHKDDHELFLELGAIDVKSINDGTLGLQDPFFATINEECWSIKYHSGRHTGIRRYKEMPAVDCLVIDISEMSPTRVNQIIPLIVDEDNVGEVITGLLEYGGKIYEKGESQNA